MTPTPGSESPLISVVIPCYNHAYYLAEALKSVLEQNYDPLEIAVIDDGSRDDTACVAASFPGVRYVYQTNRGLASARNFGIRETTGSYLLFLDADDRLCPGALRAAVRAAAAHPDAGFVYGRFRFVEGVGDPPPDNPDTYLGLLGGNHVAMCATVLFPRAIVERTGGFREELRASEDYDLYLRIARSHPYYRHDAMMAECRRHGDNMSLNAALMLRSTLQALRAQRASVMRDDQLRRAWRRAFSIWGDYYGGLLAKQIRMRLRSGEYGRAVRDMAELGIQSPGSLMRLGRRTIRGKFSGLLSRPRGAVFHRLTPASRDFGYDRGTPIDRYYIERFLSQHAEDIRGHVLEIKDTTYTSRFGGSRVTRSDVLDISGNNPNATIVADLRDAPEIASCTFDCAIVTQTLHLVHETQCAIRTLHRILKPGGVLLATLPGISQIARDGFGKWDDHWRFTSTSSREIFERVFGPGCVTVTAYGNLCAAVNYLDGRAAGELNARELNHCDPDYELLLAVRAVKS